MKQRSPVVVVLTLLLWPLVFALGGCSEVELSCATDRDCPAEYTCGTGPYDGVCIQRRQVVRCGDIYCDYPAEACYERACIPRDELPDGGIDRDTGASGGTGGGGEIDADRWDWEIQDAAIVDAEVLPTPVITIITPSEGATLTEVVPTLSGHVGDLYPSAVVIYVVDDGDAQPLAIGGDGRFTRRLDLGPGDHTITVVATQGTSSAELSRSIHLDYFVHVDQGRFVMAERPFNFIGLNAPTLLDDAATFLSVGGIDRVEEVFSEARRLGVTVIRTRAYDDRPDLPSTIQTSPGQYNVAGLEALDHVVAQASAHGIKLLFTLSDGADRFGGVERYLNWAGFPMPVAADWRRFYQAGPVRDLFVSYVRGMIGRTNSITDVPYRQDSTIMGWEIMDTPMPEDVFDGRTGAEIAGFFEEIAGVIKAIDSTHLVGTGDLGFDVNPGPYGQHAEALTLAGLASLFGVVHEVDWRRNMRVPGIDFATIHLDPQTFAFPVSANSFSNLGADWIRGHAALATAEGKPLLITQTVLSSVSMSRGDRRATLSAWFDEARLLEVGGLMLGNFYADHSLPAGDPMGWKVGNDTEPGNPENEYADLVIEFAASLR